MNIETTTHSEKQVNLPKGDAALIEELHTLAKSKNNDPIVLWNLWDGDETIEELLAALD